MENVKLSIVCMTYNHEKFIRDALDGFVMQQTDFPFEILINDDASTDKTAAVVREYEKKYPHLFRCVYQTKNQWGKKDVCRDILFPMVRGKYVALCEGDDYWTDPLKLQKQVDFLETHPDFSVCFHPVTVHWDDCSQADTVFPTEKGRFFKTVLDLSDLLKRNFIQTNSVIYRWRFHQDDLSLIPYNILPGDWFLHLLQAETGKIGFLPDVMAVYRRNAGGLWTGAMKTDEWFLKCGLLSCNFWKEVSSYFKTNTTDAFEEVFSKTLAVGLKTRKYELLNQMKSAYPSEYEKETEELKKASKLNAFVMKILSKITYGEVRKKYKKRSKKLKEYIEIKKSKKFKFEEV